MEVRYYVTDAGRCPFRDFLATLPEKQAAQLIGDLFVLGREGVRRAPVLKRPIKGHAPMWELRIGGLRVFIVVDDLAVTVLGGCRKDDQKREIAACSKRMTLMRGR